MRQFNPLKDGMTPEALEELYNIVTVWNLTMDAKLDRIKKELAVAACAIEDGVVKDLNQSKNGMLNLIAYIESKNNIESELDINKGSIELVNEHLKELKEYYEKRRIGKKEDRIQFMPEMRQRRDESFKS